jgi:hypothetical protein
MYIALLINTSRCKYRHMSAKIKKKTNFVTWLLAILIALETVCFIRALYLIDDVTERYQKQQATIVLMQEDIDTMHRVIANTQAEVDILIDHVFDKPDAPKKKIQPF